MFLIKKKKNLIINFNNKSNAKLGMKFKSEAPPCISKSVQSNNYIELEGREIFVKTLFIRQEKGKKKVLLQYLLQGIKE